MTEAGDATAIRPFDDENLPLNMSVWRDVESLNEYVYGSVHVDLMRRREWFERTPEAFTFRQAFPPPDAAAAPR
ncbi:MAG: DUF3291 domain-containing protein [Steroidobacteraceae bacterium]